MNIARALLFGCALVSLTAHAEQRRLDRTFTVSGSGTLTVEADGGDVIVKGGGGEQVQVQIVVKGSERAVEGMELSAEQYGQDVTVLAKREMKGWFNYGNQQTTVTVTVPDVYGADLRTSGGDITVTGLQGHVVGKTSGGDVRAEAIRGQVQVTTSGGDMDINNIIGDTQVRTSGGDIRARTVTGNLKAHTSGGKVQIENVTGEVVARSSSGDVVANGVKGPVDLQTSGGSVEAAGVDGSIRAVTSGGDVRVDVAGENRGIVASTNGGTVVVRLPRNVAADVDAATSGGSVSTDLPVTATEIRERKLVGTINGGGPQIRARTSGGDVRLRARD